MATSKCCEQPASNGAPAVRESGRVAVDLRAVNTATIRYRVADFLSRHAPFQFVEQADLLALAASGRVRFHERDECLFEQGESRKEFVSVIQQGTVELHEETPSGTRLRDRLGEGELLGIGRFVSAEHYLYTAKTAGDVLIYRFPAAEFDKLVDKYRHVSNYLTAYFSSVPTATDAVAGTWGVTPGDPVALRELSVRRLAVVDSSANAQAIASAMRGHRAGAAVVTDPQGRPLRVVTADDLIEQIAAKSTEGRLAENPSEEHSVATAQPGLEPADYALRLMRNRGLPIVLTPDGSPNSPAIGLIGTNDLSLLAGVNPALLVAEASKSDNPQQLARIVQRGKALILEAISEVSRVEWCAQVSGELYSSIVSRLIQLAEQEAIDAGLVRPAAKCSWLFFGGSARQELLTWYDIDLGLIIEDVPDSERIEVDQWFARVARTVDHGLEAAGFRFTESAVHISDPAVRLSLTEWKQRFHGWLAEPLANDIYRSRSFFDFRPFYGDNSLADELRDSMFAQATEHPQFLTLLATSCLAQMPPLTFFEGLVVDEVGNQSDTLDLRRSAVFPLIDSGRAFGLACTTRQPSTFERLSDAAELLPASRDTFDAAKEAYRVTLQHRGRSGLSAGDDGVHIRPSSLSKYDQQILKGSFRSIAHLLELTADYFKAEVGR